MSPVDDPEVLRRILANTDALLLDFDGPICDVFAGLPAHVVAGQLRDVLAEGGHTQLPDNIRTATDPFDVLRHATTVDEGEARYVEAAFRALEVEAVRTATPTPGAHDLIYAWTATGRPLAIVSNNSRNAIETYVDLHDLRHHVDRIAARTMVDMSQLKPSPYLVTQVVNALAVRPERCALVGDLLTDIQAARSANVPAIAYASNPRQAERLASAGPEATVTTITLLIVAHPQEQGGERS